jgi:tetratricopeptide (TPR) repeat protein
MRRPEEAIVEERLAVELDPLSAGLNARLGSKLSLWSDYDRALEQLQKALELDPNLVFTNMALAATYARKGMYQEGLATCKKVVVNAWTLFADGRKELALTMMKSAADMEDSSEKLAITPGPLAPVRELMGEMLLEFNEPTQALEQFEATLRKSQTVSARSMVRPGPRNLAERWKQAATILPSC